MACGILDDLIENCFFSSALPKYRQLLTRQCYRRTQFTVARMESSACSVWRPGIPLHFIFSEALMWIQASWETDQIRKSRSTGLGGPEWMGWNPWFQGYSLTLNFLSSQWPCSPCRHACVQKLAQSLARSLGSPGLSMAGQSLSFQQRWHGLGTACGSQGTLNWKWHGPSEAPLPNSPGLHFRWSLRSAVAAVSL